MLKIIFFCTERKTDKIADITAVSAFKTYIPFWISKGIKIMAQITHYGGKNPGGINTFRGTVCPHLRPLPADVELYA